ncbi:MAG TPA: kelch repeat-containing protein [Kofleriaceae bacterium]|jgi:hypothetical protein
MGPVFISRSALAIGVALGATSCSALQPDDAPDQTVIARGETAGMLLHGQVRQSEGAPHTTSAPGGAHLSYHGGRVVSNIQVVQVLYGAGNYLPEVTSTATPSMATFYQGVLNSPYVDWLSEYNTTPLPGSSNQTIGRGSFLGQATIFPAPEHNGTFIDDVQIQAELSAQIQAGNLPAPSHDGQGNNNTYYAIFFPHGKTITLGGSSSCSFFCAYHGTIANAGGAGEITYGVHPDFQPGSGCEFGCGAAATAFGNYTQVASHELVETMTDPEVGLAQFVGPPLAWYDSFFGEIGDICNDQNGHIVGSDGLTYDVQTEFSNTLNDCVVTSPFSSPLILGAPTETCRGTTSLSTVTVLGGSGRFTGDVTLSLTGVSPAPPPGGEITATFDPDPVPAPSSSGATSTMRVTSSATTPPGTYTLTVQGASTGLTTTATTSLVVRSAVPGGPSLVSPASGADGVAALPTFTWSAVDQSTLYTLEVFDGHGCTGAPVRTDETTGTAFTLPQNQPLSVFHSYSWRVTASNSCGGNAGASACFDFRTASCSDPHEAITNGGFENGLASWTVEQSIPPPTITGEQVHGGTSAVRLGDVTGFFVTGGDSRISQVMTLAAGSSPKLSFWEWPLTTDSISFDQQYVRVTPISPAGATVVLMNELRNDRSYIRREFDLSQFAGMTIKIAFGVHQDFVDVSGMYLDDISVSAARCGPPDFVLGVTPPAPEEVCAGGSLAFGVAIDSVNGPNFSSPVTLSAGRLPPGATASFAKNPINPGESTTMTLTTARPTDGDRFDIDISAVAVTPPPDGARTVTTSVLVDPNAPGAPEIASPRTGEVNVPRRPTLSWTAPFVPESAIAPGRASTAKYQRSPFLWELAALRASAAASRSVRPSGAAGSAAAPAVTPFAFGASAYHLQIARDAAFTSLVIDTQVAEPTFTLPVDLDIATQYFWRVSATNACGSSEFSPTGSFIVGACFESWAQAPAIPFGGIAQSTVIASPIDNKLYVLSGSGFSTTDQLWAFDPEAGSWARKADVPAPGMGSNFGSAARVGGTIYAFGGITFTSHRVLWRYDIAADRWTRGADLPVDNFGGAVAAIDGKIYLAYGSGLVNQTWQYNPATDSYTRKADAPMLSQNLRIHGVALGGEMHAFGGGFSGDGHAIYNPATNTWRLGPAMPFGVTDPAVDVVAGKAFVVGGRPVAHTQVFDPATGSWSQAAPITGATGGVDNTQGAVLGSVFHVLGGAGDFSTVATHWQFHACNLGALSSATILPFVVDGNGKVAGIGNERTSVLIDNSVSGTAMSVSCYLYGTGGEVLGHDTFQVGANELATIADVVRALTHTSTVQNLVGSVAIFGTEVFHGMASVVNNASSDPAFEDGQPIAGRASGFLSTIGTPGYLTQTVFANTSSGTSALQVLAYPPGGGDVPAAATVVFLPGHGLVSYPDVVKKLGLGSSFLGQLSWTSSQPTAVAARDVTRSKNFSGFDPAHSAGDATSSVVVPYVEDTDAFSTSLEISNPGSITANVTVRFVETGDTTGATPGIERTRDVPVAINSAAPIADIVRWVRRDTATARTGKHGFLVVTTPQSVTAQARIVDNANLDPAVPDSGGVTSALSSLLVRVEPLPFSPIDAAAGTQNSRSRFALSNPGATPATVRLIAYNATGSAASSHPLVVTLAPHGQYFSDNLAAAMGLPAVFVGWVAVQSDLPVGVYNHRRTGDVGSVVPLHRH